MHCYIINIYKLLASWFQKIFLKIFPLTIYKEAMTDPQGMVKLDSKGTVGTIQNIAIY